MKHSKIIIFALTAFFIMAGPVHADTGGESDQEHSMEGNGNDTMESIGSYTAEQRDKALEAGRKTLEAMDERIERMEAWLSRHWDSLSDEAREKRTGMLSTMRTQRNKVAEWYGGMKHASSETWDSVQKGFVQSYGKLQSVYKDTVDSFGSEDDPVTPEEE